MQNLEQIRASNALCATRQCSCTNHRQGEAVCKEGVDRLPAMIVNNGLLAAAAFAQEKRDPMLAAMNAVAAHLCDKRIQRLSGEATTQGMILDLSSKDSTSLKLRLATDEALAYISYLKRFAPRKQARAADGEV